MAEHTNRGMHRRRAAAAASGLAALALILGACGEEGTAEKAVGGATSAVGSVATQATSAVGDATGGDGEGDTGATTGEQPAPGGSAENGGGENGNQSQNPDQEFLADIRRVGVDAQDEQGYLTRGRDACASLDGGTGYVDVLKQYNDAHSEAPVTEAPVVVASAIKAFCSQHLPQIGQN
ncbi:DUF732 domain-containing protein [Rhodococcus sp. IEGM 1408]|uniref:DUF732 domain-containing protein n=1 Tax=Rhodococcus sp. IEGM 1408 TaxID=3082220 RepID=UPI002952F8F6|nr:DUF732 domain-containing protein [Rhodococcus sp. IEGM 1408]MDV7999794.1 DUF732 domain-containing protein [Rhodococcus sp. IEGM 1408]